MRDLRMSEDSLVIFCDSHMTVSKVENQISQDLDELLLPIKCYGTAAQQDPGWSWALPIFVLHPHTQYREHELYDFTPYGHLCHGVNITNEHNLGMTSVQFRSQRPDLEHFFSIPPLQELFAQVPVLGFHFDLDHIEPAWHRLLEILPRKIETMFTHKQAMGRLCFQMYYNHAAQHDQNTQSNVAGMMSRVVSDTVSTHIGMLVSELCNCLTLELQENRFQRKKLVAVMIKNWLDTCSITRVANRILAHPAQFLQGVQLELTALFDHMLDQCIYETIHQ